MSTAGNLWMATCETWLREHIWPHIGRQRKHHMGDFTGTWDLNVEATIDPWSKIWQKMNQSEGDAGNRGLDLYCVWKKHNRGEGEPTDSRSEGDRGETDAGEGAVLMRARVFFPMVARLEKLEASLFEADDQFARGWTAALKFAREHLGAMTEEEATR